MCTEAAAVATEFIVSKCTVVTGSAVADIVSVYTRWCHMNAQGLGAKSHVVRP